MKPGTSKVPRRSRDIQDRGPNWILMAGGALLSTLSVRLGYKLKKVLDAKRLDDSSQSPKDGKSDDWKKSDSLPSHSNAYCFTPEEDGCYNHYNGSRNVVEIKHQRDGQTMTEPQMALPLVTVPTPEFNKKNSVMRSPSPDPHKHFHHSNSSESLCVSESSSDIFIKREVIQKLRQQLKRRDDTILEMQDQIAELHNSLMRQLSHSSHLQSLLDAVNRDLFDSEMEMQRLRKAIADHCVGHTNGCPKSNSESSEKGRGDGEKIEMLRREVNELKDLMKEKIICFKAIKNRN